MVGSSEFQTESQMFRTRKSIKLLFLPTVVEKASYWRVMEMTHWLETWAAGFFSCGHGTDIVSDFSAAEGDSARSCDDLQRLTESVHAANQSSLLSLSHQ